MMPQVASPGDSPWLTIDEVAERFQVPVKTVRYWRYLGTGPQAVKIGRFVRYALTDVLAWETELRNRAATGA